MSNKIRKAYTAEEKVLILRRHLIDHVPISESVRRVSLPSDAVLPLAAPVFRERDSRLCQYVVTVSHDGPGAPDCGPGRSWRANMRCSPS